MNEYLKNRFLTVVPRILKLAFVLDQSTINNILIIKLPFIKLHIHYNIYTLTHIHP